MREYDEKQPCPFCGAEWGVCDHYLLLSEWEAHAEKVEPKSRPKHKPDDRDDAEDARLST